MSEVSFSNRLTGKSRVVSDPPFAKTLFANPKLGLLWLPLRLWLGYKWIDASLHKINNPAWTQTGEALKGFWMGAVAVPEGGRPVIAFDWYRSFIQFLLDTGSYTWFAKLVAFGELAIGIALILGAFTGIAAFFGGFMNWNFIMAGSASVNGAMFAVAVGLILAWKISGYFGLDYFLLPLIGTPWGREKHSQERGLEGSEPIPVPGK
jgi:thiosulfate dehydrogenase [quinone] large subunit